MLTSLSAAKRILCVVEGNLAAHSLRERDLIAYRAVGPDLKIHLSRNLARRRSHRRRLRPRQPKLASRS